MSKSQHQWPATLDERVLASLVATHLLTTLLIATHVAALLLVRTRPATLTDMMRVGVMYLPKRVKINRLTLGAFVVACIAFVVFTIVAGPAATTSR